MQELSLVGQDVKYHFIGKYIFISIDPPEVLLHVDPAAVCVGGVGQQEVTSFTDVQLITRVQRHLQDIIKWKLLNHGLAKSAPN